MQVHAIGYALGLLALSVTSAASAQSLARGRSLYFEADFEHAEIELQGVIDRPDVTHDELVEALRYLVAIDHASGRETEARESARTLLSLAPDATLPEGAASSAMDMLDAMRASPRAQLSLDLDERGATLSLWPAPSLLPTLRLTCGVGPPRLGPTGTPLTLTLEPHTAALCEGAALTRGGAPILMAHAERAAVADPPEVWPWIVLGGAIAIVVAAAIVIGVVLSAAPASSNTVALPMPQIVGW